MKLEELKDMLDKSETKTKFDRFDMEEAIMDCYRVVNDLSLSLDEPERSAAISMHEKRCDKLVDVYDYLVKHGDLR